MLCLAYQGRWIGELISIKNPVLGFTTGCEEEALFSVWRVVHGQPAFVNISDIPFASSYFNWMFYLFYGGINTIILKAFSLPDEWIPTVSRGITFLFQIGSLFVFLRIMEIGFWPARIGRWGGKLFVSTLAVFNLGFGLWPITTRPDAAAVFFELLGFFFCIRHERHQDWKNLLAALACFYFAWAFKQINVSVLLGFCLYMAFQRRYVILAKFTAILIGLFAVTMLIGGKSYIDALIFSQSDMPFTIQQSWRVLVCFLMKSPFLTTALLSFVLLFLSRSGAPSEKPWLLFFVFAAVMIWSSLTAMKWGSAENYFHLSGIIGTILVINSLSHSIPQWQHRLIGWTTLIFLLVQVSALALVVSGRHWTSTIPAQQAVGLSIRNNLIDLGGPAFVTDYRYNLPWFQPCPPYFVLAYTYQSELRKNAVFEAGGIEGLVKRRYFRTIVRHNFTTYTALPLWPELLKESGYAKIRTEGSYDYWQRP